MTVRKDSKKIDFETTLNNQVKDHRLRILSPTRLHVEHHEADSVFEVVKRPNHISRSWGDPTNPQYQQAFVNIHDEQNGVTVGNFGLSEYKVTADGQIVVTLLCCVGELGDWGYFPTPEAQCLGKHQFGYSVELHEPEETFSTYLHTYAAQILFSTQQIKHHEGTLASKQQYLAIRSEAFAITALKRSKFNDKVVVRGFNTSSHLEKSGITKDNRKTVVLNLLEEPTQQSVVPII